MGWESVAQRPGKQGGRGVPASPRQGRCYGRRSRRSKDELGPGIPKTDRQLWPAPQRMPGWRALNSVGTDYASRRRLCERPVSLTMTDLANHLHKLVVPWLLICPPVWAAKLPVPPVPPTRPPPAKVAQVPHHGSHAPTKAVLSRRTPIPPVPQASTPLTRPAPVPDQDAQPPSEPPPHTRVISTDFRLPKVDADAGYPYGSRFRSPQETQPIQTPGFTVTIPLRLP